MKTLQDKVALVAGATRGAGRGIAAMLGEAGAIVYCTGRSTKEKVLTESEGPFHLGSRRETIEETAELVTKKGGKGIALRVDHTIEEDVKNLLSRIRSESGKLDILVNDVWGGDELSEWGVPFYEQSVEKGRLMLERAVISHIITSRYAAPLMIETGGKLIIEITDGDTADYRGNLFYDLAKSSVIRLALAMSEELKKHQIAAVALTPGFLRSEAMLDYFGVTEENWKDGVKKDPHFIASETPFFVGRAVACLAADSEMMRKTGRALSSWGLSREYGFTDINGDRPHWGDHFEKFVKKG